MTPNIGDHIRFTDKKRVRYEYGTVIAVSKQNPQVFHIQDHNPMYSMITGSTDGTIPGEFHWEPLTTVHAKRIDRIIPAGEMCDCWHEQCPNREVYGRRRKMLYNVVGGDHFAMMHEERRVINAKTEEEFQGHLERLRKLRAKYDVPEPRIGITGHQ